MLGNKKFMSFAVAVTLTVSSFFGTAFLPETAINAYAATGESLKDAIDIGSYLEKTGSVRNLESIYYKYTVSDNGYIRFTLSKNDKTTVNQSRWRFQVYDSNVNILYDNLGGESAESHY
ncbi:MAG: hypothetical protein K6F00_03460, partial [Lachnospiraceae bacterium]|nr:hypothetical protein [Lachnospiraceae bacterium]